MGQSAEADHGVLSRDSQETGHRPSLLDARRVLPTVCELRDVKDNNVIIPYNDNGPSEVFWRSHSTSFNVTATRPVSFFSDLRVALELRCCHGN